jgi:hypothetical protein
MSPNSEQALVGRRDERTLTWAGPALLLVARAGFAVAAQALVAAIFFHRSPTPWLDAATWFPVYGTLIDLGCLALLWWLTRREGIGLFDLVGFNRAHLVRDVLIGLALIPVCLAFILGGVYAMGWLVFGTLVQPYTFGRLPLFATMYGALAFPFIWGLTEQMTYNGYLVPRLQVLCRSTIVAVAIVAVPWSLQHAFMPLTFDAKLMLFRALSPVPFSVLALLLYLRMRRLLPLIVAHALMDGASVLIGALSRWSG